MFWRNKYRELATELSTQVETLNGEVNIERTRRISAEALASERLTQMERSNEALYRAEVARDAAVNQRAASLDLVNTTLLQAMAPEKPATVNIKDFKPVPKARQHASVLARQADRLFMQSVLHPKKKAATPSDTKAIQ